MPSAPSKLYSGSYCAFTCPSNSIHFLIPFFIQSVADDVSLLVVTLDTNPFFWSTFSFPFSEFLSHVLAFLNSILLLSQLNQVVVIATGCNSCTYLYDSSSDKNHGSTTGSMPSLYSDLLHNLEVFLAKDQHLAKPRDNAAGGGAPPPSLLSGSLSMALCCILFQSLHSMLLLVMKIFLLDLICYSDIQRAFRSGPIHPQPRILCLQGSADGPEQYVAIMNSIFSAQHSTVPIDSCYIGSNNSAFLQQASYITGGIYYRPPHLDGLFQYFSTVFATDLHSRAFLRLPKSVGVDFRASQYIAIQTLFSLLLLRYIMVGFPLGTLFCASVISKQLTWAMYALYAYPYSVSIMINVPLVGLYLARLNQMFPHLLTGKEKLDTLWCVRWLTFFVTSTRKQIDQGSLFHVSSATKFWREITSTVLLGN
ncbi:hypothetical protein Ahy_A07g033688 isoform B [Arachis hypogaea]|uniref:General transcription and DNA repair factor IIH subunit TFB4 n=1 Tax=Arachis hypogaea TaxID=3818 RepID=A0A445C9X4_ARAHY|nr:hypothetical protein Ahy_A07g033688 isoform B [Arachis hypogaea]